MIVWLCFHGIGECGTEREPGEARYWVGADTFRGILDEVITHEHVRLSFDDGNRSDLDVAAPELVARGLRAEFYVLAGRLDDPRSLGREDLLRLRELGMGIGSHGWRHMSWRGLSAEARELELVTARAVLADASGGPVDTAALPLGRYDRALLGSLRRLGYRRVLSSDRLPARQESWLQARFSVTGEDTAESVRRLITRKPGPGEWLRAGKVVAKRWR